MERLKQFWSFLLLALFLPFSLALKFDMQAHPEHEASRHERCIRNFVAKDQLVVVTAIIDGHKGDGQTLNIHVSRYSVVECEQQSAANTRGIQIKDAVGNEYGKPRDVVGENRYAFTSHADSAFDVCFQNVLKARTSSHVLTRRKR